MSSASDKGVRSFLAWVWAGSLILAGLALLVVNTGLLPFSLPLLPVVGVGTTLIGLPFLGWWLFNREDTWALLAAWVFFALTILIGAVLLNPPYGQIIGMVALIEIAVPLLAAYLANHDRLWALIPAYGLIGLAGLLGLTIFNPSREFLIGAALLAVALPCWLAFMLDNQRRWALAPAGLVTLGALGALTVSLFQSGSNLFYVAVEAALALVFLAVWLTVRRLTISLWVAVGFAAAALLSIWFPPSTGLAALALALGGYVAYSQIRRPRKVAQPAGTAQAQKAAPAVPQPPQPPTSTPASPPPPTPPTPPPAPQPSAGARADAESTAAREREAGQVGSNRPVVEFRPLDPFKIQGADEDE
jgi:hypothetical protein